MLSNFLEKSITKSNRSSQQRELHLVTLKLNIKIMCAQPRRLTTCYCNGDNATKPTISTLFMILCLDTTNPVFTHMCHNYESMVPTCLVSSTLCVFLDNTFSSRSEQSGGVNITFIPYSLLVVVKVKATEPHLFAGLSDVKASLMGEVILCAN